MAKGRIVNYAYGDDKRIFVNTAIGCEGKCFYCYLSELNIDSSVKVIKADKIIERVNNMECYKEGQQGSIISIGCYSECMDSKCIEETKKVVKYFLKKGNYVQLSTKQVIPKKFFDMAFEEKIFLENMVVYVSIPVYTGAEYLEKGTAPPKERCYNFEICRKKGIKTALYVKPYLEKYTEKDLEVFLEIINKYNVPVIVGDYLSAKDKGIMAQVGEGELYEQLSQKNKFVEKLKPYAKVYEHSTDYIEDLRKREKKYD